MMENKKEKNKKVVCNGVEYYKILENFNGRKREYKSFVFEVGKFVNKYCLIFAGWENKHIKFLCEQKTLELASEVDRDLVIDASQIKNILIKEDMIKTEQKIDKAIEEEEDSYQMLAAETYIKKYPLFYDKARLWWEWNADSFCWENVDEVTVLNNYRKRTGTNKMHKSRIQSEIIKSLQLIGREFMPKEPKAKYIQFKDKVINIEDGQIYPIDTRFFFTNPIPWEIGTSDETPTMDKLFTEWVGEKHVQTLYEILAYCCLRKYPIQLLFCFVGSGRNGKTQYQMILTKFLGMRNICSTELDTLLTRTFESFKLYKKLACSMGETNFGILKNTSILKKLTGGDVIGFEKKQADPFDGYNYAKILINSNNMPSSQDTSDGYYRRWLILDFPHEFPEGKDIVETIPEQEYSNLCRKVLNILPILLARGKFTGQGSIEERKQKYIEVSNPLPLFIREFCKIEPELSVRDTELYSAYSWYLSQNKRRIVSRKEFYDCLSGEGFERRHTSKTSDRLDSFGDKVKEYGFFIDGLGLISDWKKSAKSAHSALFLHSSTQNNILNKKKEKENCIDELENTALPALLALFEVVDITHLPCHMCGGLGSWTLRHRKSGAVFCDVCAECVVGRG
jgi:P4 family phage/plasmid primase-like protien